MKFCAFLPAFMPRLSYFLPLLHSDRALFADHLQFTKRSPAQRVVFDDGDRLSIPLRHRGKPVPLFEKRLTEDDHWKQQHLTFLKHRYHDYPYFEDLFFELENIYARADESLSGFLFQFWQFYRRRLKISVPCQRASDISKKGVQDFNTRYFSQNRFSGYVYDPRHLPLAPDFRGLLHERHIRPLSLSCSLPGDPVVTGFIFKHGPEAPFLLRHWSRNCTLSDN